MNRTKWSETQLAECRLCPLDCRVDRRSGETGRCGVGNLSSCFLSYVHYGEEADLTPSHMVYLKGCNMACLYCDTHDQSRSLESHVLTPELLGRLIRHGKQEHARNLHFLGGEPFVHLPSLLLLLEHIQNPPPIVWDTNLYCTSDALSKAIEIADTFIVDFKFGPGHCAEKIAGVNFYWETLFQRLSELAASVPHEKIIIRHLVMPGHVSCCTRPIMETAAAFFQDIRFSLKTEYMVMPRAGNHPDLCRFLTSAEITSAWELARDFQLRTTTPMKTGARFAAGWPPASSALKNPIPFETELVISPKGDIYLQHPNREMTDLLQALSGLHPQPETTVTKKESP